MFIHFRIISKPSRHIMMVGFVERTSREKDKFKWKRTNDN